MGRVLGSYRIFPEKTGKVRGNPGGKQPVRLPHLWLPGTSQAEIAATDGRGVSGHQAGRCINRSTPWGLRPAAVQVGLAVVSGSHPLQAVVPAEGHQADGAFEWVGAVVALNVLSLSGPHDLQPSPGLWPFELFQ